MPVDPEIKERLRDELARRNLSFEVADELAGLKTGYLRNALNRGRGKAESLVKAAVAIGMSRAWLYGEAATVPAPAAEEARKLAEAVPPNARMPAAPPAYGSPIQVLGVSIGGEDGRLVFNGEVIETIPRPPELEGVDGAYAAYVIGDSMKPRFREGDRVWIHPRRPPRKGLDVIVQLFADNPNEPPEGYIKEFVNFSGKELVLLQHNPAIEIRYTRDRVKSIHVIVGALYA